MRMCRLNHTLKLITRPCKALRIAIVRQRLNMKHETEIDRLLKELLYDESWMDDQDYKEVIDLTFRTMGITKQKLSDDIEIGIKNGYTVKQQIDLLKRVLNVA